MKKATSKTFLCVLILLSVIFSLFGCSSNPPEGDKKDIVILFTSDVHCGIESGFGYAGLVSVRDILKKDNHVLLVDNGDAVQGETIGMMTRGEAVIELMNEIGYDAAIPGNHEFDYGMEQFLKLADKAEYPYISANLNKNGELVFEPFIIKEVGGIKIGFVGITTPKTLSSTTPKTFQDENGSFIYDFMQNDDGQKLYDCVQKAVNDAKTAGAEKIVILGHTGNEANCAPYTYADIIANVSGINAYLDGHSHDTDTVTVKDKDGKNVIRSACGTKLNNIGYLTISADGSMQAGLYNWSEDTQNAVAAANDKLDDILNKVVAKSEATLTVNDPTAKDSTGNPVRIVRNAETNLGDLCADAFRIQCGADIGMINGGGIRANLQKGDVTLNDLYSVQPFGNMVCVIELTGQQLLDMLEWGAKDVPAENGSFLQVSGITYEIHTYIPSSCTYDEYDVFTGVTGEYRVKNVTVGGQALELDKTYTLASVDYYLKNGGGGYSMIDGCKMLLDGGKTDCQVLIDYITEELGGTIGDKYADPYGDERIVAVEKKS